VTTLYEEIDRLTKELEEERAKVKDMPTPEQFKKYCEYVDSLTQLYWSHTGDVAPVPDLVAVRQWLSKQAIYITF